ncbi:MAG: hypothetical protein BWX71_02858 [Deltaproteobacteria bacterium ADurb.Bin072]|nr:MAG: hypothetical protein BWX71_02858 [Deltaproteobacteria bacterium ADurb.Bin072]
MPRNLFISMLSQAFFALSSMDALVPMSEPMRSSADSVMVCRVPPLSNEPLPANSSAIWGRVSSLYPFMAGSKIDFWNIFRVLVGSKDFALYPPLYLFRNESRALFTVLSPPMPPRSPGIWLKILFWMLDGPAVMSPS